ncbi:MAG: M67 family metallopeptidase [Anaerolineales bacterium]
MRTKLILLPQHWHAMHAHVAKHAPLEACGLLAGKKDRVEKIIPIRNQAQSPVRFRMDPKEQLDAFEWIDDNGLELLGIFHSHPTGPETASATDIEEATYPVVHIIWDGSHGAWNARGFWIENGKVVDVDLEISHNRNQ